MDGWAIMVVILVAIIMGTRVALAQIQSRNPEQEATHHEELEALRARIEVLEKIVTDRKYDLARELDSLEREP